MLCRFRHFSIHGRRHTILPPEGGGELAGTAVSHGLGYPQHAEGGVPQQLRRPADSPAFQKMMEAYLSAPFSGNERAVVSKVCRKLLNKIVRPSLAVPYVVALGKRNLLWDLLPDHIEEHVLEVDHAE